MRILAGRSAYGICCCGNALRHWALAWPWPRGQCTRGEGHMAWATMQRGALRCGACCRALRVLKALRVLRLFKLFRYMQSFKRIGEVRRAARL